VRLSSTEIKKIALSLIAAIAVAYCYFVFLLSPLRASAVQMLQTTAGLEEKIVGGKMSMQEMARREQSDVAAIARSETLKAMVPDGAPLAWVPPRMKSFLSGDGVKGGVVRLINTFPIKQREVSAFVIDEWIIEFPHANFLTLVEGIARTENKNPLWRVVSVRIHANDADPEQQSATLGINTIVRK